jgi:hypothetical protein
MNRVGAVLGWKGWPRRLCRKLLKRSSSQRTATRIVTGCFATGPVVPQFFRPFRPRGDLFGKRLHVRRCGWQTVPANIVLLTSRIVKNFTISGVGNQITAKRLQLIVSIWDIKTLAFRRPFRQKVSRKGDKTQRFLLNSSASLRLCVRIFVVIMFQKSGFQPTAEPSGLQPGVALSPKMPQIQPQPVKSATRVSSLQSAESRSCTPIAYTKSSLGGASQSRPIPLP